MRTCKRISVPVTIDFMSVSNTGDGHEIKRCCKVLKRSWISRWKKRCSIVERISIDSGQYFQLSDRDSEKIGLA